ncbi:hypothetical protein C624_06405 [Corynebacterium glutamicum SCgG1]|nr:hypothetical protein C624_06405 [Corynebacterium glutamicum SCgG1]
MIIVLIALIVIFTWVFAKLFGRGEQTQPLPENNEIVEHNRQAVGEGNVDNIMFDTVIRGYRQDQVDDVIEHLKWQVDSLNAQLEQAHLRAKTFETG